MRTTSVDDLSCFVRTDTPGDDDRFRRPTFSRTLRVTSRETLLDLPVKNLVSLVGPQARAALKHNPI